jgi:hypothetical protein
MWSLVDICVLTAMITFIKSDPELFKSATASRINVHSSSETLSTTVFSEGFISCALALASGLLTFLCFIVDAFWNKFSNEDLGKSRRKVM